MSENFKQCGERSGVYAVRFRSNWDGEGDILMVFASLSADGKWVDEETNKPLLEYEGDEILQAWLLNDPEDLPDAMTQAAASLEDNNCLEQAFALRTWFAMGISVPALSPPSHSDDAAVDRFAAAMKAKLAMARVKGRGGWDDPAQCSVELLAKLLVGHVGKGNTGNFEDIANLAMMLHQRNADPKVLAEAAAAAAHDTAEKNDPALAVLRFMMTLDDHDAMDYLRAWNEGCFAECRKEWPEAPAECYIGADPLYVIGS
ncbi:hypothetical protein [Vogesella sp. XCS3]|uniref:hypothetical protein n=1 Tax=Vogesella sp. XCS3 TaxID=2877939 RepID=UPI001D0B5737|nr:hypothetical protein [Vogesella sp. XCS3]UDM18880.1 hypothetical protein LCH97_18595 [Vogesella sp. XCS3]